MTRRQLTSAVLALLCALQLWCVWRAAPALSPAVIGVTVRPGASITLGRDALAAPQAAIDHVQLRRGGDGRWWISNVSGGRPLMLGRAGTDWRMGSTVLQRGQWFQTGPARFSVTENDGRGIVFDGAGHRWRYDGALLLRDGGMLPACPGSGAGARALALWNRISPHALSIARPLTFGGNLHCGNRLGVPGQGAAMLRAPKGILLTAGAGQAQQPLLVSSSRGAADLARREEALAGVTSILVGRTRMAVRTEANQLQLRPVRHVALYPERREAASPGVNWTWKERGAWTIPHSDAWWPAGALAVLLAAAFGLAWQQGAWPCGRTADAPTRCAVALACALLASGVGTLLVQRGGAELGVGVSMLLAWTALWSFLSAPARPSLATCAGVLLLAVGLLAQLELGMGALESSWLRHFQKTASLLAIGLGVASLLVLRARVQAQAMPRAALEWALAGLAACAVIALALQVMFGDETGVFDLQPVEFAKLALTALTAHCLAIGLGWHAGMPQPSSAPVRWLRLAAPALLFIALLGIALLQVDDYSPLILLLIWAMAMALAWSFAARQAATALALCGVACIAVTAIAWLRTAGGGAVGAAGFYGDRFAVWLDPASHPHTGQQMLLAARAIADGAWWGAPGPSIGSALHIPAVQDDFAPSFFIHRHGLAGALALWLLQVLFVAGLLQTAWRGCAIGAHAGDFRQAWLWRFRCFVLCGGAAFVAGHLLLSWGTNLAIFPIMGQPMSFLSAGGSHLLFFLCPLLAFHAVSAQSIEEKASCRSMSNTKSWAKLATYSMPKVSGRRRDWRCSRAARCCATCWNALRANIAGARRRAAFRM